MDDNLFIEYINSPYEEPQDMLPKIDETMLTDMESSLETDFKNEYQHEDVTSILESIEYIRIILLKLPMLQWLRLSTTPSSICILS